MDGLVCLVLLFALPFACNHFIKLWLSVKHPKVLDAWETQEEKRRERNKKMAGGAVNLGLGIAKTFLKK